MYFNQFLKHLENAGKHATIADLLEIAEVVIRNPGIFHMDRLRAKMEEAAQECDDFIDFVQTMKLYAGQYAEICLVFAGNRHKAPMVKDLVNCRLAGVDPQMPAHEYFKTAPVKQPSDSIDFFRTFVLQPTIGKIYSHSRKPELFYYANQSVYICGPGHIAKSEDFQHGIKPSCGLNYDSIYNPHDMFVLANVDDAFLEVAVRTLDNHERSQQQAAAMPAVAWPFPTKGPSF